jgi:hypothetical protein
MAKEEWKIIKEFEKSIDGYPYKIKARILQLKSRNSNKTFSGMVSHHCKPSEQANGVMRPQAYGGNLSEIESELMVYIKTFTSIGVEENEFFDQLEF